MNPLLVVFLHWLSVSLPLMLIPTIVLIVVIATVPEAFRSDWPADIQRHMVEPTTVSRRQGIIGGLVFLLAFLGAVVISSLLFVSTAGLSFWWLLLSTTLACFTFVILDILVVDWLVICWWQPRWILIPGTEHCPGWKDYGFHLRVMAEPKVIVVNLLLPLIIAVIIWVVAGIQ